MKFISFEKKNLAGLEFPQLLTIPDVWNIKLIVYRYVNIL